MDWRTGRTWRLIGYSPWGLKESDTTEQQNTYLHSSVECCSLLYYCIGEDKLKVKLYFSYPNPI